MIEFNQNEQQEIPETAASTAKVIGVGGAGSNVVDRLAMEDMDGAGLLSVHTDVRALANAVTSNRVQLGKKLTHGLGAGGDPEIGRMAALEAEDEIRAAVNQYKMVFVCAGLGGGTGSGAAPEVVRMAREAGAFVVAFVTMPFSFEGPRRLSQANQALDVMRKEANALITFDNDRMGELIVESDGIQKAFEECDKLIAGSIRGVAALVTRPGLIKIGLDDLLTALRNSDSRCLFGSGRASGDNRAKEALRQALNSPLLAKGKMFSSANNILVHITGGEDLRLHEIEGLMRELGKSVPEEAQLLFGAAIDPSLKKELCVTLFSSLSHEPVGSEEEGPVVMDPLPSAPPESPQGQTQSDDEPAPEPDFNDESVEDTSPVDTMASEQDDAPEPVRVVKPEMTPKTENSSETVDQGEDSLFDEPSAKAENQDVSDKFDEPEISGVPGDDADASVSDEPSSADAPEAEDEELEPEVLPKYKPSGSTEESDPPQAGKTKIPEPRKETEQPRERAEEKGSAPPYARPRNMQRTEEVDDDDKPIFIQDPTVRIPLRPEVVGGGDDSPMSASEDDDEDDVEPPSSRQGLDDPGDPEKSDKKGQPQLDLEKSGEGRFAKSEPTIVDGEDLDTPAYLRKRKRRR